MSHIGRQHFRQIIESGGEEQVTKFNKLVTQCRLFDSLPPHSRPLRAHSRLSSSTRRAHKRFSSLAWTRRPPSRSTFHSSVPRGIVEIANENSSIATGCTTANRAFAPKNFVLSTPLMMDRRGVLSDGLPLTSNVAMSHCSFEKEESSRDHILQPFALG